MTPEQHKIYVENRNKQIYKEVETLLDKNRGAYKEKTFKEVALKYGFAVSHIMKIYYDNRAPVNEYSTIDKHNFICELFVLKRKWYPEWSKKKTFVSISEDLLIPAGTINIFIIHIEKTTQQEHNQELAQTDEAC